MKIGSKEILNIINNLPPKYKLAFLFVQERLKEAEAEGKFEEAWEEFRAGWNDAKNIDCVSTQMPDMPSLVDLYKMGRPN